VRRQFFILCPDKNGWNRILRYTQQMNRTTTSLLLLACLLPLGLRAQEVWSLERCVRHALDNNITIKQAQANVRTSQIAEKQAKSARLPNADASVNYGKQFGLNINPVTNALSDVNLGASNLQLSAGLPLFNGGRLHHGLKQSGWDLKAAQADAENTQNTLALQVAQAYLSVLQTEEQLENTRRRVVQSEQQLRNTDKLIEAGTTPLADRYNLQAQIARDEQAAVVSQNNVDLAYLTLKLRLQLEPDYDLRVEQPAIVIPPDFNPEANTLSNVYTTALNTQPGVRSAEFRIKSAETGIQVAKSQYYPSVSLFANLNSRYSSVFRLAERTVVDVEPPVPVRINGVPTTLQFIGQEIERGVNFQKVGYFDQLNFNFGQSIGIGAQIPLYQNNRIRLSVERARLNLLTAQMQDVQTKQQLKNDIQTAIANAKAGKRQLEATQKTYDFMKLAYENMVKRHALGAVNGFDLTTAKNNMDNSENDLVVAKYDYLFRLKILDFYLGKPLILN
jgi:outer membrane protein